jgi:hypothetical protein
MCKIYVLPISGGGFVSQLALLSELYDATVEDDMDHHVRDQFLGINHRKSLPGTPDLVLASSGGNVAAYLAMVSGWSSSAIANNMRAVKSSIFVQPWTPSFLPTWVMYPFTQSVYRNGSGMEELFTSMYTPISIKQTEIWSGTYNTISQKSRLFCNLSEENSFIKASSITHRIPLYDSDSMVYLDGDIVKISKAVHASAAIPIVTEGVYIDSIKYSDGGVSYSSPLVPISEHLKKSVDKYLKVPSPCKKVIQMFYFCSYDMEQLFPDTVYAKVGLLIHSSALQDRAASLSFMEKYTELEDPVLYPSLNSKKLREILREIKDKSYLVWFYPLNAKSVNVADFSFKELQEYVEWTRKNYAAIIWIGK